jgi:hypothetical protein
VTDHGLHQVDRRPTFEGIGGRGYGELDEYLNRFLSHGRRYGVSLFGGTGFSDGPRHVFDPALNRS